MPSDKVYGQPHINLYLVLKVRAKSMDKRMWVTGPNEEDIALDLLDGCEVLLTKFLLNICVYSHGCCCHQIQPDVRGEEQLLRGSEC